MALELAHVLPSGFSANYWRVVNLIMYAEERTQIESMSYIAVDENSETCIICSVS